MIARLSLIALLVSIGSGSNAMAQAAVPNEPTQVLGPIDKAQLANYCFFGSRAFSPGSQFCIAANVGLTCYPAGAPAPAGANDATVAAANAKPPRAFWSSNSGTQQCDKNPAITP